MVWRAEVTVGEGAKYCTLQEEFFFQDKMRTW